MTETTDNAHQRGGSPIEVLLAFFKLGLTSFGGPIAHLGYFRREFVERRRWLSESQFAQLLTICQFLPGPASSQLGFCIGLLRAGTLGALGAFVAFTLPSALLLVIFAGALPYLDGALGSAAVHGLKIVAFAVVAQGVVGMARQLCPDTPRRLIATLAAMLILVAGTSLVQLLVVAVGAAAGLVVCRTHNASTAGQLTPGYGVRTGAVLLGVFLLLLLGLPLVAGEGRSLVAVAEAFYRAGALVFGGGHVVLPLLEETVVDGGWIAQDQFLAGYGAAQAIPGPMFAFSAYLGFGMEGDRGGIVGAVVALVGIFLPGFLLVTGVLPFWQTIARHAAAARAIAGVNAAVVGILGAALYDPIFVTAIRTPVDMAIALIAFVLLTVLRLSALFVVVWCVVASLGVALLG